MEALTTKGIYKHYSNHTALDDVSISIPEQSIYGLLGPNGAGKTTLIRIINQIITADQGEIFLGSETLGPKHIGTIGYLPEERGLYKKLKVGEQLVYFAQLRGLSKEEAFRQTGYWVDKLNIKEWWGKKVEDLSKGMAQKVQFISTVMHKPKLIILDEPFSGFDPVNANLIQNEILELRECGSTIIFSTHRMETVEQLCDHIALIHKGKKILEGSKKSVKQGFRNNTYSVIHRGQFTEKPKHALTVKTRQVGDELLDTTLQISEGSSNDLLAELIELTEVHRFEEQVPDMHEIFIQLVKEEPHG
ncbi:MAG: ATP-binding cassette domain-containing protein [Cyclobacteriaceae bacterium]